jgi:hypothetical protein
MTRRRITYRLVNGPRIELMFDDKGQKETPSKKGVKELAESKKIMLSEAAVTMPHAGHDHHLCFLRNIGLQKRNLDEYKNLIRGAKYFCKDCGLAAANAENLCFPEEI